MIKLGVFIVAVLLLSACATTPSLDSQQPSESDRLAWLQQQQEWQFEARFSIRLEDGSGSSGGSGKLSWKQTADSLEMDFYGALGRGAWRLSATPQLATLRLADGRVIQGADIEAILRSELGWDIPIVDFSRWLRGAPAKVGDSIDAFGRPQSVFREFWKIEYRSWMQVDGYSLPKKIELTAPGRRLKLAIKTWEFH